MAKNAQPTVGDPATRRRLIDTATRLLVGSGAESVSLSKVARDSGVTRQGAYYHFPCRDDLLKAVRERVNEQLVGIAKGSEKIENVYSFPAELAAEEEKLIRLRILEMLARGPDTDLLITTRKKIFASHRELGRLQSDVDHEIAAIIASTSLISAYVVVSSGRSKKERHERARKFGESYFQLLFHGVVQPGPQTQWSMAPEYQCREAASTDDFGKAVLPWEPWLDEGRSAPALTQILLREAVVIIEENGGENLTISELAQRLGVTRQGLYYHFKSRAALLKYVNDALRSRLLKDIDGPFHWRDASALAGDFASCSQLLLALRVKKMLEWRAAGDPLIRHGLKVFRQYRQKDQLQPGVDADIAATLVTVTFVATMVLALSPHTGIADRQRVAQRVALTYQRMLHHGVLDLQSYPNWPRPG